MRYEIKQTSYNHYLKAHRSLSELLQITIFIYCFLSKLAVTCTLNALLSTKLNTGFNKIDINHRVYERMLRITIRFVMNTVLYH